MSDHMPHCPGGKRCQEWPICGHDAPPTSPDRVIILSDRTRFGGESGAGLMRNRCAFTSKDMGAEFGDAFTYAIVFGWGSGDDPDDVNARPEEAERWGWDAELVAFLRDAHQRFSQLADRTTGDA
jgi:hypothetical protein